MEQIEFKGSTRENVSACPWIPHRINRQRGLARRDKVVAISSVHALFQGRNILISCAISIDSFRGAAQQQIDCRGNQFNVAVFLGRNVGDEIEVRLAASCVHGS